MTDEIVLGTIADCDAHCLECGYLFAVALQGVECPKCGNKNLEKINILFGGSLGHEEPISVLKQRIRDGS